MKKAFGALSLVGCLIFTVPCEAKMLLSSISGVINVPSAHVRNIGEFSVMAQQTEVGNVLGVNATVLPSLELSYSRFNPKHARPCLPAPFSQTQEARFCRHMAQKRASFIFLQLRHTKVAAPGGGQKGLSPPLRWAPKV